MTAAVVVVAVAAAAGDARARVRVAASDGGRGTRLARQNVANVADHNNAIEWIGGSLSSDCRSDPPAEGPARLIRSLPPRCLSSRLLVTASTGALHALTNHD